MGSWFSNIHIRKNETVTEDAAAAYIESMMAQKGYLPADSAENADGAAAILAPSDSPWISVCSDLLTFEDPMTCAALAEPMSAALHTDVLGIACFDSDYLYLNLIHSGESVNAWVGIGSAAGLGIKRRTGLAAWKKKVADFPHFSACAKKKYLFAEEFLTEAASCLELPPERSCASYECLEAMGLDARVLWFRLPEGQQTREPPKLVPHLYSGMPSFIGKPQCVDGVNIGGESRGLSVYFLGPYVEHEEITFSDVCFVGFKNYERREVPIDLKKVQLADGQWAYHYHDPGFRIPPKVDERLPLMKRMRKISDQSIIVRFVPQGDPRKILDITVVLVPDKNPEGQTGWNVWHSYGSKEAFIARFNEGWESHRAWSLPESLPPVLHREDFD